MALGRAAALVGGGGGDRLAEAVGLGAGELLFPAGCSFPGIQPSGRARFLVYPSRVRLSGEEPAGVSARAFLPVPPLFILGSLQACEQVDVQRGVGDSGVLPDG